jgi:hypothetical protein
VNDKQENIAPKSVIAGESSNSVSRPTQISSSSQSSVAQSKSNEAASSGESSVGFSNKNAAAGGGGRNNDFDFDLVDSLSRKRRSLYGVGMSNDQFENSDDSMHDTNHDHDHNEKGSVDDEPKHQRILVNITIASDLGTGTETTKFYQLQVAVPTNFQMHEVDVKSHGPEGEIHPQHAMHIQDHDPYDRHTFPLTPMNLKKEVEPIFDYNTSLTNKSDYYYYLINGDSRHNENDEISTTVESSFMQDLEISDDSLDGLTSSDVSEVSTLIDDFTESTVSLDSILNNSFSIDTWCKGESFLFSVTN